MFHIIRTPHLGPKSPKREKKKTRTKQTNKQKLHKIKTMASNGGKNNNDNYVFNSSNMNDCNVSRANIMNNVQQNIISTISQILHGDEHNYYTKSNINDQSNDTWNDPVPNNQHQQQQHQQQQQPIKKQDHSPINKLNNFVINANNYRTSNEQNNKNNVQSMQTYPPTRNHHFNAFNNGYTPILCQNQEQYQADYWPDKGIVKTSYKPQFMELIDFPGSWHLNENKLDLPTNNDRAIQLTRNQYFPNAHHTAQPPPPPPPSSGKNSMNVVYTLEKKN